MFRRIVNNKITKVIGIRRLSHDNNTNIIEEIVLVKKTLQSIGLCLGLLNVTIAIKH